MNKLAAGPADGETVGMPPATAEVPPVRPWR